MNEHSLNGALPTDISVSDLVKNVKIYNYYTQQIFNKNIRTKKEKLYFPSNLGATISHLQIIYHNLTIMSNIYILPKYSMQESENIETLINNHEFHSNETKNLVEEIQQCNNQYKKDNP